MQVKEYDGVVPIHVFALVATTTVLITYAFRLGIRSWRLVEYYTELLEQVREDAAIKYNAPTGMLIFLFWAAKAVRKPVETPQENFAGRYTFTAHHITHC